MLTSILLILATLCLFYCYNYNSDTQSNNTFLYKTANDRLKNDLDEVEELTTRVRNSISIDLSNTRRYSPLLYEYYRKQLELARSIQSTYNIQCKAVFLDP